MSDDPTLTRRRSGPPSLARLWTLRVLYTGWAVQSDWSVVIPEGVLTIGRLARESHDLAFAEDRLLSRAHAQLIRTGRSLRLKDLDSRNGTYVNGERVVGEREIADGDVIRAGDTFFIAREEPPELTDIQLPGLSGSSPTIRRLRSLLTTVAGSAATVVLLGESGTGKGVCARALHELSGRTGRFVHVNCAAIPENLAESTFFGHVAGAFTGASQAAEGVFRAADKGTLFIDEVGDLPAALQPKLLHVLDNGMVTPVGGTVPVGCDVRVIAATNVDLVAAVQEKAFRGDLYARLAELVVEVPPLRERREDMLPLLWARLGPKSAPLSPDLVAELLAYRWPFNVREVERVATELSVRGVDKEQLEWSMIARRLESFAELTEPPPSSASSAAANDAADGDSAATGGGAGRLDGPPTRAELEALLRAHRGVIAEVARHVGRSTKQVYRWMSRYDIDPDDYRE